MRACTAAFIVFMSILFICNKKGTHTRILINLHPKMSKQAYEQNFNTNVSSRTTFYRLLPIPFLKLYFLFEDLSSRITAYNHKKAVVERVIKTLIV